ncbi:hypothetical protein [Lentilactobacillus senioris]|uniref:hypothetical protein n=1 Tax=Lentilactobacillus senioris TaxID=931534 RepID=UPI003D2ABB01
MKDLIISAVIGGVIGVVGFWVVYYIIEERKNKRAAQIKAIWSKDDAEETRKIEGLKDNTVRKYNQDLYDKGELELLSIITDTEEIHRIYSEDCNSQNRIYVFKGSKMGLFSNYPYADIVIDKELDERFHELKFESSSYLHLDRNVRACSENEIYEIDVYKKEQPELGLAVLE